MLSGDNGVVKTSKTGGSQHDAEQMIPEELIEEERAVKVVKNVRYVGDGGESNTDDSQTLETISEMDVNPSAVVPTDGDGAGAVCAQSNNYITSISPILKNSTCISKKRLTGKNLVSSRTRSGSTN